MKKTQAKPKLFSSDFWDVNKILSISAIFISFMTFLVLIYQTKILREQQLLSSMPYIDISNRGSYTPNFKIILTNQGIGPAVLEEVNIFFEGKKTSFIDLVPFVFEKSDTIQNLEHLLHSNIYPGRLIPAGEIIPIFEVIDDLNESIILKSEMDQLYVAGLEWEIIYSSVYKEKWRITHKSLAPEKL
ncbi:hypothetical protein ACFOUP_18455 [Belliella kenyensis]|uniref:FixH protein n=1 Tax=Belliella kenyensis TaxID=1472724 RepID=A0ABV8ERL6_9BACT|nr:hypothetical protein [Belliella kenyensis]MCH7402241.1 hypothetical protein [Belliella kenyensis]MDN3601755.1 hypothetical protein [Belliella kenyensis]